MHDTCDQLDCSVIISTRNRRHMLVGTIADLEAQQLGGLRVEAIIVDNGSSDGTRELLTEAVTRLDWFHYVYEPALGPANGRNAGIARARGRVIAFTDDDNRIGPDWIAQLVRTLDERSDVDAVAGRIIPKWISAAPEWLTRDHWVGPLALQDYGEQEFIIDAARPIALSTANLAMRRSALESIGNFSVDLQRAEDTELLVRFWRAGGRCLYAPRAIVAAEIQPERMTRQYHAWWHNANGAWTAAFDLAELVHRDGSLRPASEDTLRLWGVPAFLMRELMMMGVRWAAARARGQSTTLVYEHRLRFLWGYICSRYRYHRQAQGRGRLSDVLTFLRTLVKKKFRAFSRGPDLKEDWSAR
jgi:glucosyl-dolichyl phosphate glucuronosyltransferase